MNKSPLKTERTRVADVYDSKVQLEVVFMYDTMIMKALLILPDHIICSFDVRLHVLVLCFKIFDLTFQDLPVAIDMKPAHTLFRDQVNALVGWFSNWNECEQTIALYTLLKRISTTQARFLSLILEHTFREDSVEVQLLQRQANDKGRCQEERDLS